MAATSLPRLSATSRWRHRGGLRALRDATGRAARHRDGQHLQAGTRYSETMGATFWMSGVTHPLCGQLRPGHHAALACVMEQHHDKDGISGRRHRALSVSPPLRGNRRGGRSATKSITRLSAPIRSTTTANSALVSSSRTPICSACRCESLSAHVHWRLAGPSYGCARTARPGLLRSLRSPTPPKICWRASVVSQQGHETVRLV